MTTVNNRERSAIVVFAIFAFLSASTAVSGEKGVISLRDFSKVEVKSAGFTLPRDMHIHILALGGGDRDNDLYAFGWIINAETREEAWRMDEDNTSRHKDDRSFDGEVSLPAGSYEAYFTAYAFSCQSGFSSIRLNIDRRDSHAWGKDAKKWGFFSWLDGFFGGDMEKEWKKRSVTWGMDILVPQESPEIPMFNAPREFPSTLFQAAHLGENETVQQSFVLDKPMNIRIYALGEMGNNDDLADYSWIIDSKSRKRFWEMSRSNVVGAGGAGKNVVFDRTVAFPAGSYLLHAITDNSHSYADWNTAPPSDPFNYGVTLIAAGREDRSPFRLTATPGEKNVIVQLIQVTDDETRSASFALKADTRVRVYALGERGSRRQMADYGWIMNAKTRDKAWTMDVSRTEFAGGDSKNRMIDEVVTLPKGAYTVYYQSDGSHSYNHWNSSPPFDPGHWGITVSAADDDFDPHSVEKNIEPRESGVVAQIVRVGDNADKSVRFTLDKPARLRIFAIGEGENREMFDYGWIEDEASGKIVWEMTYSMTFHAGGARKNRLVNTSMLLDKGRYLLHYVSDGSHSFSDWNSDPPDDPTMWGITLYAEE